MPPGSDEQRPAAKRTGPRRSQSEATASKPAASGAAEGVDMALSAEASIGHVILDVIGALGFVIIDAIPDAADTVGDIVDIIGNIVWDITVHVLIETISPMIIVDDFLGGETREALADLGLGELDPSLESLQALAANPAARELFAKRMIEAQKQGKAFPLPSARELIEYRDRYLRRALEQGR